MVQCIMQSSSTRFVVQCSQGTAHGTARTLEKLTSRLKARRPGTIYVTSEPAYQNLSIFCTPSWARTERHEGGPIRPMSIPECVRYRNSTMFVGTPPFGYEGTDDCTSNSCSSWHPPKTPSRDMTYREPGFTVPSCTNTHPRSRSRGWSRSPNPQSFNLEPRNVVPALFSSPKLNTQPVQHSNDWPNRRRDQSRPRTRQPSPNSGCLNMKLSNVLPALFSLPKLGPQIAQHSNQYSDVSRLSVHDVKLSPVLNDDPRSTLEDVRGSTSENSAWYTQSLTHMMQKTHWGTT